jgi:hypothetical protein
VSLNNSGNAGPIWLNFFCQLRLGHGMVLGQKNLDPRSGFSVNPEKPILAGNCKIFLQKSSISSLKDCQNNSDNNDF